MKTEEDAFWMLAVLLENVLMSDCYTDNLSGCHVEQRVFKDLLAKKCPRIAAHLEAIEFDVSLVATEWFLCLFSKSLPSERYYRFFYMFVFSTTLLCIYLFGFCWVYIKRIMDSEHSNVWKAMSKTPASIVLIVYTFVSVWFVGGLSVFHLYLIATNQTTYENFRYRYDRRANPYNRGIIQNFIEVFFTKVPPSKNNFRAMAPREQEQNAHTSRMGFMGPNRLRPDLEEARKPVIWNETGAGNVGDLEAGSFASDASPDLAGAMKLEGSEGNAIFNSRRSSWGRRSGNWEMPADVLALAGGVGDSNRTVLSSTGSITSENHHS